MAVRLLFAIGIAAAFLVLTPVSASAHCHEPTAYSTVHAAVEPPAQGSSGKCGQDALQGGLVSAAVIAVGAAGYTTVAVLRSSGTFRRFSIDPPTYEQTRRQPWIREKWFRDNVGDATNFTDVVAKSAAKVVEKATSDSRTMTSVPRHTQGQAQELVQANNPTPLQFEAQGPPDPLLGGALALSILIASWISNDRSVTDFAFRTRPPEDMP